jgi:hypothetical protein
MLEEFSAALADAEVQPHALHVGVFGLAAGAVLVVRRQSLYGAFGEKESLPD